MVNMIEIISLIEKYRIEIEKKYSLLYFVVNDKIILFINYSKDKNVIRTFNNTNYDFSFLKGFLEGVVDSIESNYK